MAWNITRDYQRHDKESFFIPYSNDDFGSNLAVNPGVSTGYENIHDGGTSSSWNPTVIKGSNWNFNDAGRISTGLANNGDAVQFIKPLAPAIDMSQYLTLTGKIELASYNANKETEFQFFLAGSPVGVIVSVNPFIDPTLLGVEQSFTINKSSFGITNESVDELRIVMQRNGGARPSIFLDDLHLNESTGLLNASFRVETPPGFDRLLITGLRMTFEAPLDLSTTTGTVTALDPTMLMNVPKLTNGLVFRVVTETVIVTSQIIKCIGDLVMTGGRMDTIMSANGTTLVSILIDVPEINSVFVPPNSYTEVEVNDDLSAMNNFTALLIGYLEVPK